MKNPHLFLILLLLSSLPASAADVVVFGDSWAEGAADELAAVFVSNGRSDISVAGYGVGGTTAEFWATTNPNALPDAVTLNPDAQWVWLSIGGNDLFANYMNGLGAQNAAIYEGHLRTMLDALFVQHPTIQVVMFGYDYVNFEQSQSCIATAFTYFGWVATSDINGYMVNDVHGTQMALESVYPNLTHVHDVLGTLQAAGGIPGAPNPLLPSPSQYMADCIHPTSQGYTLIHQALFDAYWALPAPIAGINAAQTSFCVGESGVFTANGNYPASWYLDGQFVTSGSQFQTTWLTPGLHSLELSVRNGAWVDTTSVSITVGETPIADAGPDQAICPGESVQIGSTDDGISSYAWSAPATLDDVNSATPTASPTTSLTYTLTVTSPDGCIATDDVFVEILSTPNLTVGGPNEVDVGEEGSYQASSQTLGNFSWELDGGGVLTPSDGSASVAWDTPGDWTLTAILTPDTGCRGDLDYIVSVLDPVIPGDDDDSPIPPAETGCSCQSAASSTGPVSALLCLIFPIALLSRRR